MAKPHPADALVQDVLDYVEKASSDTAQAILGSAVAPQTATMTAAEKTRYLANQFWNPDGTPNQPGRDKLQASYGAKEFLEIAKGLADRHGQLSADVAALPEEA